MVGEHGEVWCGSAPNIAAAHREGFPRADCDLWMVRTNRGERVRLINDHKALMKDMDKHLEALHAAHRAEGLVQVLPFAALQDRPRPPRWSYIRALAAMLLQDRKQASIHPVQVENGSVVVDPNEPRPKELTPKDRLADECQQLPGVHFCARAPFQSCLRPGAAQDSARFWYGARRAALQPVSHCHPAPGNCVSS